MSLLKGYTNVFLGTTRGEHSTEISQLSRLCCQLAQVSSPQISIVWLFSFQSGTRNRKAETKYQRQCKQNFPLKLFCCWENVWVVLWLEFVSDVSDERRKARWSWKNDLRLLLQGRFWGSRERPKSCRESVRHGIGYDWSNHWLERPFYGPAFEDSRGRSLGCRRCRHRWVENAKVECSFVVRRQKTWNCFFHAQILLVRWFGEHGESDGINKCRNENSHIRDDEELFARQL